MIRTRSFPKNKGFTLLEVLISMIIIAIGLLGLAALQSRSQQAELESYQRAQALLLVEEMVNRLNNNRRSIDCYDFNAIGINFLGTGVANAPTKAEIEAGGCSGGLNANKQNVADDLSVWHDLLLGSTEDIGGTNVGAMIGARGCITSEIVAGVETGVYTVTVAWQGMTDTVASANTCATGLYGNDARRRVISTTLRIADLK